ncbi:signal peptidase, endoplasmic reticulum-type [Clostridium sp. USBA 49]|uniref:signal peptidase I n=1 Tax=Clostridium sp. USBA 49 TaxID=1881060 RepID=UPI00099AB47C|nr:signal peptidase I [Clostridium sp. USBA 49]SKA90812.1 signal peptidase, endoplasmic reticulum-type [Clostridium sp. USBA 49]
MNKNILIHFILIWVILIYVLDNAFMFYFNKKAYFIYIIKPLIWFIAAIIVHRFPKVMYKVKVRYKKFIIEWIILLALFYVTVQIFMGFVCGFAKNPYNLSLVRILQNYMTFFPILIGQEKVRSYLINSEYRNLFLRMLFVSLLFTLINIPLDKILNIKNDLEIIQFMGYTFLPKLCLNIMAVYLVYLGGETFSILYIGIIEGIKYILPILPNLNFLASSFIGIYMPIFSMFFIQNIYLKKSKEIKKREVHNEKTLKFIFVTFTSVFIIWFFIGIFPVYPVAIATGSMKPLIKPGDIVLVKKIKDNDISTGDIIQYKNDNIYVFHRVVEIVEEENEIKYETKGDNNQLSDSKLVSSDMIKGKVIKIIPKAGWPVLIIKNSKENI